MMKRIPIYRRGEPIVYRLQKHGTSPSPGARNVYPTPRGEEYIYHVDVYWIVCEQRSDGIVIAQSAPGLRHLLRSDDPLLRRATWWERLWCQDRFPPVHEGPADGSSGDACIST